MSSSTSNSTRKVLVTGGNKGIGKAICERLLTDWKDTHVIMGCRSPDRGRQAMEEILNKIGLDQRDRIEVIELDTSSDSSVLAAAQIFAVQHGTLYGIVNNAGVWVGYSSEDILNTNYFGPRRVNDAFQRFLSRPGGRIVNMSSAQGPNFVAALPDEDLKRFLTQPWTIPGGLQTLDAMVSQFMEEKDAYGASKAFLNAYTVIHAKLESDLVINACTPGFIDTELTSGMGAKNPTSKGAVAPCFLLMEEKLIREPNGRYYGSDCVRSPLHMYRGPGEPPYENEDDLVELLSAQK